MSPLNVKARLYRLWELLVIRWVLITGKGKRRREWIHYRRSMGARKGAVTKKAMKAARAGAADGNQAGSQVSGSFTPPGQSDREPYLDEGDALLPSPMVQ